MLAATVGKNPDNVKTERTNLFGGQHQVSALVLGKTTEPHDKDVEDIDILGNGEAECGKESGSREDGFKGDFAAGLEEGGHITNIEAEFAITVRRAESLNSHVISVGFPLRNPSSVWIDSKEPRVAAGDGKCLCERLPADGSIGVAEECQNVLFHHGFPGKWVDGAVDSIHTHKGTQFSIGRTE